MAHETSVVVQSFSRPCPERGVGLDGEQRPRAVTRGRYVVAREPLLLRTGQERLAGHGSTCRRGTGRRSLAPDTGQVSEYRTRHRSASRPQRNQRGASRNRHGKRSTTSGRNRSARGNWGTGWNRRRTSHSGDRGARRGRRNTHLRNHRGAGDCWRTDFTRGSLDARVAARHQRGSCRVRAQRYRSPAQPDAGNDFDAESVESSHRRQLPHPHSGTSHKSTGTAKRAQPHRSRVPPTKIIFNGPMFNMHWATPHCVQIVTFGRRQPRVTATGSHRDRATQSATH